MKRTIAVTAGVLLSVFLLSGVAFAWQGRMAGMSDPLGLVEDESDLLTNPAKLADGKGVKYYGNYGFTYTGIQDLNWNTKLLANPNVPFQVQSLKHATGDEFAHDALLGAAFPLGAGRMGIFFDYAGKRSDSDGQMHSGLTSFDIIHSNFTLDSDVDNFALRVLYAQPVSAKAKIGGEVDLAYRKDNKRTSTDVDIPGSPGVYSNTNEFMGDLVPFMFPGDTDYWEILGKVGLESDLDVGKLGVTLRGGGLVSGSNDLSGQTNDFFVSNGPFAIGGKTDGWKAGGDMWLRHPLCEGVTMPLLARFDFSDIHRYGTGIGGQLGGFLDPPVVIVPQFLGDDQGHSYRLDARERLLHIEAGGGVDVELSRSARIAAGIYYDYIYSRNSAVIDTLGSAGFFPGIDFVYNTIPNRTEHLARLKLAGEAQVSPAWTVRAGVDAFAGTMLEEMSSALVVEGFTPPISTFHGSLDGTHWGITGSLGASARCMGVTVEPWVMGGYQEVSIRDGNASGVDNFFGAGAVSWDTRLNRNDAIVGAGFSILY